MALIHELEAVELTVNPTPEFLESKARIAFLEKHKNASV